MTTPIDRLQDAVDWRFTVTMQGSTSRYGRFGGLFYKQYLPAGIPVPEVHPPKRISQQYYEFAKLRHETT